MDQAARSRHVVAVPYPGRGHVNPMMVLCRQLAARGFHVTFVVTEEWLALLRSSPLPPPPEVRLMTIPNCIPSENGRARDFVGFVEAVYTKMGGPFERLLSGLEPPPAAIIADTYLPWAVDVGRRKGIPVCSLFTMSATFFSVLLHFNRIPVPADRNVPVREKDEYLQKYIPSVASLKLSDVDPMFSVWRLLELALQASSSASKADCVLFTSLYELESSVIDSLRNELACPVYPLGPSIPYMPIPNENSELNLTWLDSQPENSVLYISLGSFLSVSPSQLEEIIMGVLASKVKFFWVARDNSSLVQEKCGNTGLVVPWCEQLRVLTHPSIGGFLTHCGMNSTLETLFAGVPVLTFPIFWDQLPNRRLLVDEWKVGIDLKEKMGRDGIVTREVIANVVNKLMDLGDGESQEMRRRAFELREASLRAVNEGGSSFNSLNSFIEDFIDKTN